MNDLPHAEAIALLTEPTICPDPSWTYHKIPVGRTTMECGLVSMDGKRKGLHVQLHVRPSAKTGLTAYRFSVFRIALGAPQRVYQLDIDGMPKNAKNWHQLPHEHMGDQRTIGAIEWSEWAFMEALDFFCHRTNITFDPQLDDPSAFSLKP